MHRRKARADQFAELLARARGAGAGAGGRGRGRGCGRTSPGPPTRRRCGGWSTTSWPATSSRPTCRSASWPSCRRGWTRGGCTGGCGERNPAPFAAYLDIGRGRRSSRPRPSGSWSCAGGRSRPGRSRGRGRAGPRRRRTGGSATELLASEKDRAENVMIVDLLRNDLSRVCRDHTVLTPEICVLESFATVHHLVSTVTGELRPGLDAVDLLRATFPGGSITGAPKIRAMEIIAELEPTAARTLLRRDRLAGLRRLDGHQHHHPHLSRSRTAGWRSRPAAGSSPTATRRPSTRRRWTRPGR